MGGTEIDWIVKKASALLEDKVLEDSLDEEDVDLAYQVFAEPRLRKISDSFGEEELKEVEAEVMTRLREKAWDLNQKHWRED